VVPFVSEEWGYSCGSAGSVVVCEFGKWEKVGPVVLLIVTVYAKILLQGLVGALGLPIALWVVTGGEV